MSLLLRTHLHALDRVVEVAHGDLILALARAENRRFVHDVFQIRAREIRRALGDVRQIHVVRQRLLLRMHAQNRLAAAHIGIADGDLAVKPARTQQRRIENVLAVRRRQHDHALVHRKAVHFNEQLVERLLALVVAAAHACAASAAHRVDFIDKNDARRMFLRLVKQIAHAACAHADKHFHKVRTGNGHKRHACFARDGLRQQRFACAGRADKQHALGNARADRRKSARIFEELDQLLHLFFFFDRARDVRKGDAVAVRLKHARRAVAEGHHLATAAALLAHHHHPERHQADRHDDIRQHFQQPRRGWLGQIAQIKAEVDFGHVVRRRARLARGQLTAGFYKRIPRNDGAEIIGRI